MGRYVMIVDALTGRSVNGRHKHQTLKSWPAICDSTAFHPTA